MPAQFISGPSIYSYSLSLSGNVGMAGIVFKPAALSTMFQLPMFEYTEERIDLYQIFRKDVVDKYVTGIRNANTKRRS